LSAGFASEPAATGVLLLLATWEMVFKPGL